MHREDWGLAIREAKNVSIILIDYPAIFVFVIQITRWTNALTRGVPRISYEQQYPDCICRDDPDPGVRAAGARRHLPGPLRLQAGLAELGREVLLHVLRNQELVREHNQW